MNLIGVFVNCAAIVIGTIIGLLFKKIINEKYKESIMHALGISVVYVGMSSAISSIVTENTNSILFVVALVSGTLIGEILQIELFLENVGKWIESKFEHSMSISRGFVAASLIFCIGAMSILGSIDSGLLGNHTTLYIKSFLDFCIALILSTTLGIGVAFSAIAVFIYQGSITLFSSTLQHFITPDMIHEINLVGGILISIIGLNLLSITKIKVGNMLPSILIVILYCMFFSS